MPVLVVGIGLLLYTMLLGNPVVAQAVLENRVSAGSSVTPAVVTFPKWDVLPGPTTDRGRHLLSDSYWPSTNGSAALRTFNLEHRWADWITQNLRTGMLVIVAPLLALLALRSSPRPMSWLQLVVNCWLAVVVAGAGAGLVANIVYRLFGGETLERGLFDPLLAGTGFGALFGLIVGLPLAVVAATVGSSRQSGG